MSRLLHPIPEAAESLAMGRSTLYEKIGSGEIVAVKVGRRRYVAHDELERYVRTLTAIDAPSSSTATADRILTEHIKGVVNAAPPLGDELLRGGPDAAA